MTPNVRWCASGYRGRDTGGGRCRFGGRDETVDTGEEGGVETRISATSSQTGVDTSGNTNKTQGSFCCFFDSVPNFHQAPRGGLTHD